MKIKSTIFTSLKSLSRNPMRALLTTLGIVIGIASVITMMEIGAGSSEAIRKSIQSIGSNIIMIAPGNISTGGVSYGSGSVKTLTPQDCDAIIKECPSIKAATPTVSARGQVVYGNKNWVPQQITGATPAYFEIRDWNEMSQGEPFTMLDVRNANKVCVIGKTVMENLFDNESPVGKEIRIMNIPFKVLGVLKPKGANMMGMDQDDLVVAPWTTIKYRVSGAGTTVSNQTTTTITTSSNTTSNPYPASVRSLYPEQSSTRAVDYMIVVRFANIGQIVASAKSEGEIKPAIDEITRVLRQRHRLTNGKPDDFDIRSLNEILDTLASTTKLIGNLLLSIAMISLLVGGVGIMNIMLVSVSERTREIGLRMAVGARQRDVLLQFLTESVLLCITGGIIGILLGHGSSLLVAKMLGWPISASPVAIMMAVVVSVSVGLVFGFYPAWKASRLDPIEALRYE